MELNGSASARYYLTPEGWVASSRNGRPAGAPGPGAWREPPERTVETWELEGPDGEQGPRRWRQVWVNGRVHPMIRDGIRESFPPPVEPGA